MKLFIKPLLSTLFILLFISACSEAEVPQEGKQYSKLPAPLNNELLSPITEVFSLTCSHCRNMEKHIPEISKAAGTDIGKLHTTFNKAADSMAHLYYAAEIQLKKAPDPEFMESLFAAIRLPKVKQKQQAIEAAFASHHLVNPYKMSVFLNKKLAEKINKVRQLSRNSGVKSVPAFIVNGRYKILLEGHKSSEEIGNTMKYLLAL
ncbi:thioredoxin domain-containing protein [Psychromonas sp. PT13]|uniref:thioredoxin domain-containing protein n=1 Tax=Psychromonas sp. PT13 TaxID=3439547 RepID=UPI003EC0EB1F